MSIKQYCSLCCNTCSDYKELQNKEGESNEIYEITVKYFDPMLLTEDGDTLSVLNVLCQVCWSHIQDFHEFQQTILKSRMSWEDKVNFKQLQQTKMETEVHAIERKFSEYNYYKNDQEDNIFEDSNSHRTESYDLKTKIYSIFDNNSRDSTLNKPEEQHIENNLINTVQGISGAYDENKKEIVKPRRGRKAKSASKYNSENTIESAEKDNRKKVRQSVCINKGKGTSAFNAKKAKKVYDACIAKCEDKVNFEQLQTFPEVKMEAEVNAIETNYAENNHDYKNDQEDDVLVDSSPHSTECCSLKTEIYPRFDKSRDEILNKSEEQHKENNLDTQNSSGAYDENKKEIAKPRRGRKAKSASKYYSENTMEAAKKDSSRKIGQSASIHKEKGTSAFNMKKAKESDDFIAEWKPELICDICSISTTNFDELRKHFKDKHTTRFYIKCCERKFYRRCVLVNHIQLHLNPETHKCDICGKTSSTKHNLKLHKKVMHEDTKQLKCDKCEKLFKQKVTLERHLLTHVTGNKDFICADCGKGYVAEQLLKLHIKYVHNVDRVCDQCGKTIHGFQALRRHLMEHAGIERPKFPCDICGLELKSLNGLKRHKAAYHNDGSTIYVCGVCGKVATSENALRNHKRLVHVEERKYKCTYCDKAFKRPKTLREHIATHTGQDLYQCPHCPQTFKVSANMHHHRKKMHPVEWEEGRRNRLQYPKVNINQVKKQVVI